MRVSARRRAAARAHDRRGTALAKALARPTRRESSHLRPQQTSQYSVHVWNSDENFQYVSNGETYLAMDGGDGMPSVRLNARQRECVQAMQKRTKSNPKGNPTTGADLGGAA